VVKVHAREFVDEAYNGLRPQLVCYLMKLTHDREQAEDFVQESYARLLFETSAGRPPRNARAWLYQVARNLVVSDRRRLSVATRAGGRLRGDCSPSAEDHALLHEAEEELLTQLTQFGWVDRTALLMVAHGYSCADIARAVGRSESAVRTRICRARLRLRMRMLHSMEQRRFVDPDESGVGSAVPHYGAPGGVLPRILEASIE
jgi:RNA polymerase sigma-70 factor, ECF subfamily